MAKAKSGSKTRCVNRKGKFVKCSSKAAVKRISTAKKRGKR